MATESRSASNSEDRSEGQGSEGQGPPTSAEDARILAYNLTGNSAALKPGRTHRSWMDATPDRFAYRCLPLVIANQLGWDIVNPVSFRARWLGGESPTDIQVDADEELDYVSGHFGSAVMTFSVGCLFRTPPGMGLIVTGPPNTPKDSLYPLTGYVETDWSHSTFTMNYIFTRPWQWVEFSAGESFCRLIPTSVDKIEELQAIQAPIKAAPELAHQYDEWQQARGDFNRNLQNPWSQQSAAGWQKEYFQGLQSDGKPYRGHRTHVRMRKFIGNTGHSPAASQKAIRESQPARTANASEFLWADTACFEQRQQKHAEVLVGIVHMLRRRRPFNGGEQTFLDSFERVQAADQDVVSDIVTCPQMHCWTRIAFALLDSHLNGAELPRFVQNFIKAVDAENSKAALLLHLQRFRLFELAVAIAAGDDCRFEPALAMSLPCAIPESSVCIEGDGEVQIFTIADRHLKAQVGGQKISINMDAIDAVEPPVWLSPTVDFKSWRLRLQPQAAARMGFAAAESCREAGNDYQFRHVELIREAMGCIERFLPDCFAQVSSTIRLIALKPVEIGNYTNTSFSELPGFMFLSIIQNPYVMADRIIHEFHHNRLFHIEDAHELLDPRGPAQSQFYSPWRDDARPLRGVLHGLYVYIAVGRYWLSVWRFLNDVSGLDHRYVADQARRTILQCRRGANTLSDHADFTPFGEGIFQQLRGDIATLEAEIDKAGVPRAPEAWVMSPAGIIDPQISGVDRRQLTVRQAVEEHHTSFLKRSF